MTASMKKVALRAATLQRIGMHTPPATALIVLALLVFGVSGGMLWDIGINYDGLTGSAAQKIHPATYLAVLLFLWSLFHAGNPVGNMVTAVERRPASVFMAVMAVALAVQIALRGGAGIAGAIDSFLLPALVCLLLVDCEGLTLRKLETTVHAVITVNGLLGIFEFITGHQVFPYRMDGMLLEYDTRAMALQGHPLPNANLTAVYIVSLCSGGGRLSPMKRALAIILQLAALVTFGGRSAIVVTLAMGGVLGLVALFRATTRGRLSLLGVAATAFALPVALMAVLALISYGFFDALLGRFVSDGGSANSRVVVLDLFSSLSLRDILLGPDPGLIDTLRRMNGLEMGLENPIVRMLLYQGAISTGRMVLAFALFLREVACRCRPGIAMTVIAFVVLVNTYESLGSKTTLLAKFVILLIALYRWPEPGEKRPPGA